ncbi:MAG: lactonase family protein [Alphaproteobacteria bacterium]
MADFLFVCLQDEDKIASFAIDAATGALTRRADTPLAGGPSVLALSPDRRVVYVGRRAPAAISSYRIDPMTGALSPQGSVEAADAPTFLAPDRTGRYLLAAYYQGGYAAAHPLGADGSVGAPPINRQDTAVGAHAIATDPSNRYAFVPHISRVQDNVLEPPKNIPGPNFIAQFRFDVATGALTPNTPFRVEQAELIGPRHYCFHPDRGLVYFSDEQGCSVSVYRLDPATGALSAVQRVGTLPDGFSGRNTCSQIHLTPSARFLYVGNRGHNSIAGFAVDAATGQLRPLGHAATEAVPSAFGLDPGGNYLFAAGTATGKLASYRIDTATGALAPLAVIDAGRRPAAVMATRLTG